MLILNGGIPRSGTTWVNHVVRQCLGLVKAEYDLVNTNSVGEVNNFISGYKISPGKHTIMHYHDVTPALISFAQENKNNVRSFFNYRDPRDVVCSQMKMRNIPFEKAKEMTGVAYLNINSVVKISGTMFIPYTHLVASPETLIFQIAVKLGSLPSLADIKTICANTSFDSHKKQMEKSSDQKNDGRKVVVGKGDSMFGKNHLQSGETGRWKTELSSEQKETANRYFADIIDKLGF